MTNEEKNTVSNLRNQGYGYKRIAGMTGISVNTIKSFCNTKKRTKPDDFHCMNCGKPISHIPHKKKRKFCSDKCRMDWWRIHPEKREKSYAHKCLFCGKDFIPTDQQANIALLHVLPMREGEGKTSEK